MGLFQKLMGNASAVSVEKLQKEYEPILMDQERIEFGFSLIRDVFLFTGKRLILIDVQGVTGKKKAYKSIPYKSISRFSVETAGTFDLDAELKVWISGEDEPTIDKPFNKSIDVYAVQKLLAEKVCG
ncbi:PH domain-containing protein [Persicobacter psychrovividus]|uniref:Bacterial Pleckstrin homology domain-containing protein n=1 Tax=Persicobacter psychrovividus TaxID=387638 RepID=A0ABN6L9I7_9BACT|nr:hypothetical protein PEPS_21520 [Persicobacter psychrovividus]